MYTHSIIPLLDSLQAKRTPLEDALDVLDAHGLEIYHDAATDIYTVTSHHTNEEADLFYPFPDSTVFYYEA